MQQSWALEKGGVRGHIGRMKKARSMIETVVAFGCSAAIAALSIGYIAIDELGISSETVRASALLSAGLIGSNIVIEAVTKARKAK